MADNTILYGFETLNTVMAERVSTVGFEVVYDAIRESTSIYNQVINDLMGSVVERVTWYSKRFKLPSGGTLQPLDDKGNPLPTREEGYYDVALPIQGAGDAWGTNRVSSALITVEDAARNVSAIQRRDADWLRRHILAAWFDNATWSFTDPEHGALTIQPLAITSDGVKYVKTDGTTATDQHFLAQAAAISDAANPFETMVDELKEHPSNMVSEGAPVIVYYPSGLNSAIKGLADFVPASNGLVIPGVATDRAAGLNFGTLGEVTGTIAGLPIVLRRWDYLPANYMLAHASAAGPFIGMREYPVAALQGLFPEDFSPDGNWRESRWIRYAGFGVFNRVAALVQRVGNGSYAIPTGYDAPLGI